MPVSTPCPTFFQKSQAMEKSWLPVGKDAFPFDTTRWPKFVGFFFFTKNTFMKPPEIGSTCDPAFHRGRFHCEGVGFPCWEWYLCTCNSWRRVLYCNSIKTCGFLRLPCSFCRRKRFPALAGGLANNFRMPTVSRNEEKNHNLRMMNALILLSTLSPCTLRIVFIYRYLYSRCQ